MTLPILILTSYFLKTTTITSDEDLQNHDALQKKEKGCKTYITASKIV